MIPPAIYVKTTHRDTLKVRWQELARNLALLQAAPQGFVELRIGESSPLSVVPLVQFGRLNGRLTSADGDLDSTVSFNWTIDESMLAADWLSPGAADTARTFLVSLRPANSRAGLTDLDIETFQNRFMDLLGNILEEDREFSRAVLPNVAGFVLTELLANVQEHSGAGDVSLGARFWKEDEACELLLADNGCGL